MKPTFTALMALCLCVPVVGADKKKSGTVLWEFETGGPVYSSPAIGSDGTVYVGSQDKKLYAINGKSGVKLWEFKTGYGVHSSPAIGSDGTVYVGSYDYKLYAINGKSGGCGKKVGMKDVNQEMMKQGMRWDADIKILKVEVEHLKADVKRLEEGNKSTAKPAKANPNE